MFRFSNWYIGLIMAGLFAVASASGGAYLTYHAMKFRITQKETIILDLHNTIKSMTILAKEKQDEFNREVTEVQNKVADLDIPDNIDELKRLCKLDPNCTEGSGRRAHR